MNTSMPVVFITGASSGIGYECAQTLAEVGFRVYGTSRNPSGVHSPIKLIRMDVTDEESIRIAIQHVIDEVGHIDILVNNAGIGYGGALEDTSSEEAQTTLETNFFGVLNVCRAVLPSMRSMGSGLIVNISSVGGLIGLPFQGLYSASKFALEGMTETLRLEVRRFGIRVVLINPGDLATPFTSNRRICQAANESSVYDKQFQRTLAIIEKNETGGSSPELVAKTLLKVVSSASPKPRYIAGTFIEKVAVAAKQYVPTVIFDLAISLYYGMDLPISSFIGSRIRAEYTEK